MCGKDARTPVNPGVINRIMINVLTDIFSILCFSRIFDEKPKDYSINGYDIVFHLVENLILCDRIVLERNGIRCYELSPFCEFFRDAIAYVEYPYLYPIDQDSFDLPVYKDRNNIEKRAILYLKLAQQNDLYFSPHPIRHKFLRDIVYERSKTMASEIVTYFDQKICQSESGQFANINVKIPPVVEHCLYFAKNNNLSIPHSIMEIRNSKNARKFREFCSNIDSELRELNPRKKVSVYQKIFKDVDRLCVSWKEDLKEKVNYQQRNIALSKIPLFGKVFEILDIKNVVVKDPIIHQSKPHFLFINDLYRK